MISLDDIKDLLCKVEKPSRYTGGEFGATQPKDSPFRFCMCFPEVYEVGMSNLGSKIVAASLEQAGFTVDWCFAPWGDFGAELKAHGVPLYSLALKEPLGAFDMLGFSLGFELSYTNLLYMLDLAGIPLLRKDRDDSYPVIACGGPCTCNPEPLADFVDLFFLGDGEELDAEVAKLYVKYPNRQDFYREAAKLQGVYVPALQTPVYQDGTLQPFSYTVKKAFVSDLDKAVYPSVFAVPNCEAVHDRAVIEVMRGCYRGCRFCQAGFLYRPVRPRSVETLTKQACELIANTGYDEVSMNSLSTGDYPDLRGLLRSLKEHLPSDVTLALPSLRVDSFDGEFAQDSRKSSLTFAPEAGTQRLRDVINKDITEEEILKAAESAFALGYSSVKLYFMIGLPTETDEDLLGIAEIARRISELYYQTKRKKQLRISVSVSTFIPKPFTPFQWSRQATEEEVEHKLTVLKNATHIRGVHLSWNDYFVSELEATLARGDRSLGKVILAAYQKGCKFDAWDQLLQADAWKQAFAECGVAPSDYTREFSTDEVLPWEFVDIFVDKSYLLSEYEKSKQGVVTGSCIGKCHACGIQKIYRCQQGKKQ